VLKLGEDNSDPIKVHPELNSGSSPRPSVRVLATELVLKISVASGECTYCVHFAYKQVMSLTHLDWKAIQRRECLAGGQPLAVSGY